ncbi:MAG: non-canonical purine NTP pyrophosphatase [Candidatus Paceibacterota bacterium]
MKKIIMGTTNPAKIKQLSDILSSIDITVEGVDKKSLPEVIEDGNTAQENARKKAMTYSKFLNQTVFSMDNALFIDGLKSEDQPGIHVRRINHLDAVNDEELLEHYVQLIRSLGGKTTGHWEYGICIAQPNGKIFETTLKTPPRIFTSKRSKKIVQGYPLESIQIDTITGTNKYFSEMTTIEQAELWRKIMGPKVCSFVESAIG